MWPDNGYAYYNSIIEDLIDRRMCGNERLGLYRDREECRQIVYRELRQSCEARERLAEKRGKR